MMNLNDLKDFLDAKVEQYNTPDFVLTDPIQIPHRFDTLQDREISAFLTATITWGNRKSIIQSANKMMKLLGDSPFDFVQNHSAKDLEEIKNQTIHRTFKGEDLVFFIQRLRVLYEKKSSLEYYFLPEKTESNMKEALYRFRTDFLGNTTHRAYKHVSSTHANSSAKRLMMLLRWLVRRDQKGVDLGIWKNIPTQILSLPLDVHVGNLARAYGLLVRKQNDWKSVEELDGILRKLDVNDPAKYDFALFGMGINEKNKNVKQYDRFI